MAAPIARVRVRRPAHTNELSITPVRRPSTSMIETSPFRHPSAPSISIAPPEPGETFGQYMVYEQLGEGGMARVHRAEVVGAAGFRKTVALKRMRTVTSENPDFVTSFIHEGHLIGKLKHPNIAQAYELGKIEGTYYIAMEYVAGPNLGQVLSQSRRCAGAIPLPIILEILIQLCDALEHAHDLRDESGKPLNLIHRDISPMNVIVSRAGTVKLIDFGIAKVRGSCVETQAGIIKGKHAYVAPEYTLGTGLDRRVDLWGLGVVAHEMITGRRLFLSDNEGETIRNVRLMEIPPPSRIANNISPELDDIVMTALQRDPDLRWQNAGAMRAALTAEARRQRAVVSGAQIRDWIEWAFRQPTRESPVGLDDLEPSISIEMHEMQSVDVSGEISRASVEVVDPEDVPTVDAVKPPAKIVISRDVLPLSAIPRLETARAPRATTPIQLVRSPTAIPSLVTPARQRPRATPPVPAPVVRAPSPAIAYADTDAIPQHVTPVGTYKIPRRAPRWNPPTRWSREEKRKPWPQLFVLAMLLGFGAMSIQLGWIDLDAWREIIDL
jgi:serine/threonine protein kinase